MSPVFVTFEQIIVPVIRDGYIDKHVRLVVVLEAAGEENAAALHAKKLRLRDAFIRDLHAVTSRRTQGDNLSLELVKRRFLAVTRRIVGPDVVRDVLIKGAFERPLL